MNIGGFLSGALTTATDAEAARQAGLASGMQRARQYNIENLKMGLMAAQEKREEQDAAKLAAMAHFYTARTPNADALRAALIADDNDPSTVDAVLASGNPMAIRDLLKPQPAAKPTFRQTMAGRVNELVQGGMDLGAASRQARQEFGLTNPTGGRAADPTQTTIRNARQAASSARSTATADDRKAQSFQAQLPKPGHLAYGDTSSFPALRDSVTKYQGQADSARQAAAGYDQQANRAAGLHVTPVPAPTPSGRPNLPPLSDSQKQRAKTDPNGFGTFLQRQGYQPNDWREEEEEELEQ